jgi:hypothetical protein
VVLILLVYVFLVKGVDHLLLTLLYTMQSAWRRLVGRGANYPKEEELRTAHEKPTAILLPCTYPNLCEAVARNYLARLEYENCRLFLGVPDSDTDVKGLNKLGQENDRLELIELTQQESQTPAHAFNRLQEAVKDYEQTYGVSFSFVTVFTANGSPHPLTLKYFNFFIDKTPMIQLPLLTMLEPRAHMVNGIFADEFSERYSRDMSVRAMLSGVVPSSGTGTAFSRDAVAQLAEKQNGSFLDTEAILPLRSAGLALRNIKGRKLFLEKSSAIEIPPGDIACSPGTTTLRPVAVYERFPSDYQDALHQKARWFYGSLRPAKGVKMGFNPGHLYFQLRDKTLPFFHIMAPLAYLVAAYVLVTSLLAPSNPAFSVPPLLEPNELHTPLLGLTILLAILQVVVRALLTGYHYGGMHAMLSVLRYPASHFLNAHASWKGLGWFLRGTPPSKLRVWRKPPAMVLYDGLAQRGVTSSMPNTISRLGDIMVKLGMITSDQLKESLEEQRASGRKLGEVLIEKNFVQEEDLVFALADQNKEEAVEIDPYTTPIEVLMQVPRSLAERYRVFPLGTANDSLVLATDVMDAGNRGEELSVLLGRPVVFQWTSSADISFAIGKAYERMEDEQIKLSERLGPRLVSTKAVTEEQLKTALRQQKRTKQRLGDVLVELEMISREDLEELLK